MHTLAAGDKVIFINNAPWIERLRGKQGVVIEIKHNSNTETYAKIHAEGKDWIIIRSNWEYLSMMEDKGTRMDDTRAYLEALCNLVTL